MSGIMQNPYVIFDSVSFIIFIIFTLPIIVWSIALMFNAFKVSTGGDGQKLVISFIIGLIIAEAISKIIIFQIIKLV